MMVRRIVLTLATIIIAFAALTRPMPVAAASSSSPAFFSTGSVECMSPGWQVRIKSPTVGTLFLDDRLRPTSVVAAAYVRLYDGVWSDWSLQRIYEPRTANAYAAATWDDTVRVYRTPNTTAVQVYYRAWLWNGRSWVVTGLFADDYTTYIEASHFRSPDGCVIA